MGEKKRRDEEEKKRQKKLEIEKKCRDDISKMMINIYGRKQIRKEDNKIIEEGKKNCPNLIGNFTILENKIKDLNIKMQKEKEEKMLFDQCKKKKDQIDAKNFLKKINEDFKKLKPPSDSKSLENSSESYKKEINNVINSKECNSSSKTNNLNEDMRKLETNLKNQTNNYLNSYKQILAKFKENEKQKKECDQEMDKLNKYKFDQNKELNFNPFLNNANLLREKCKNVTNQSAGGNIDLIFVGGTEAAKTSTKIASSGNSYNEKISKIVKTKENEFNKIIGTREKQCNSKLQIYDISKKDREAILKTKMDEKIIRDIKAKCNYENLKRANDTIEIFRNT